MQTIPIVNNKTGCDKLIELIRTKLEALDFKPQTFPAVKIKLTDNLTQPIVYRNDGTKDSLAIIPDNKLKSFIFFEKNGATIGEVSNNYDLSLIFWYNLKLLDANTFDNSEFYIKQVYNVIKNGFNSNEIDLNYDYRFENYSFIKTEKKEMLMYPFGCCKFKFNISSNC